MKKSRFPVHEGSGRASGRAFPRVKPEKSFKVCVPVPCSFHRQR